jgi:phosphatidylglycerol:prolipoprotein diacylglycerol transferase
MSFDWYLQHPGEILAVWHGGLGIPGGVIGGVFGIWLFCRRHGILFADMMDTIAPALPLGQAIGRWGNFVNQELYGRPSTLPWAIRIDPSYRISEYAEFETYHPLFLYESLYNLLLSFCLWRLDCSDETHLKKGSLFLIYLIAYPTARFFLEFLRLDTAQVGGINMNQVVMAVTAVTAAAVFIKREGRNSHS